MTVPLVSVVIPFANHERHLDEAIGSVRDQTHTKVQLILVDDGSTDQSSVLANKHVPPARYVRRPNGGAGAARNTGVAHAVGEFLAFCDADDVWEPTKLEHQLECFSADPTIDAVFASVTEFQDQPEPQGWRNGRTAAAGALPSALLIRKAAYERVGPFAEGLRVGEWFDWYTRMKSCGLNTTWLPDVLVGRRLHARNTGLLRPTDRVEYTRILRQHIHRDRKTGG